MSQHANASRNTSQASQVSVEPHLPTHIAAFRNDVNKLKGLIEEGALLLDEESLETPLHVAARCGSDAVVKYLLDSSEDSAVLAKAVNGSTPAHYAAIYGQLSTLKLLLEDGEELRDDVATEKDTQGLTVLHLASLKGDEQVVGYLLKNFSELEDVPNEAEDYPIHFASASGHLKVVKTFVKICGKEVINKEDINGTLPVYFAAQEGKLQVLKYLIVEVGADPVARDNDGLTTLHAATQGGHLDVVRWLVSELGEEFIVDETQDGATPIHIAAAMGYPDILEWFFKRKDGNTYVNLRDRNKRTPCHDAAEYGHMEALIMLLKFGAKINVKDSDGKTPLMLAQTEHKDIASFIMEYNREGAKILSRYESSNTVSEDEGAYAVIDDKHTRKGSSSVRTAHTEHKELVSALNEFNEVQEYRLRRQESLQAIENELKEENNQEKQPRKKSKKSSTGFPDKSSSKGNEEVLDPDHYAADSGDIYAWSRKQSSRQGSGHVKKSSSSHGIREMERKKSPPSHWYNGVAEDGSHDNRSNYSRPHHRRHDADEETSLYSYMSSGSRPHLPHSVPSSAYSGHSMASAYRHGNFLPYPGYGYGNYGYPMYPGPRGYPSPAGYPPMYPPYGYPPPPPMMNKQRPGQHRGRGDHGNQRSSDRPQHNMIPHQTTGDAPRGRKTKTKTSSIDYAAHGSKGEQMIGYGPDISTENGGNKQYDEDPDFHPLPPPITKDGEMKEYVTTEDQNFIMVKRTNQSRAATVHPSGLQLNPAKHPFVYDGRYDKYIEQDDDWEDPDPKYGVPVLAACAAILGIGVVTSLKGVARRMNITGLLTPTHATKDRAYESLAWDSTAVGSAQASSGRVQKKMTSSSSLRGNLLFDSVDDMDTEEMDPIEYSLREESGLTQTIANSNMTGSTPASKIEYRSATLPSKRKAIMQMDFSDDNFAKMIPQYGESADDTHVDQVGGGLGESLQSRNASMLDLAPSGFRDGEEAYDSEELEGVENIVHRDVKNTEKSKESRSSNREVTITKDVKKVTENTKAHKEKKKKERGKGRNEKKILASLQPVKQQSLTTTTAQTEIATLQQAVDVHHTELEGTSSTSLTSSHHNSSQLLDHAGTTKSQQADLKSTQKAKSSQQSSAESLNTQKETRQVSATEKNIWHVTMESYDKQMASNQTTMESAIAQLTSQSSSQHTSVEATAQPTSVMVEVSTVQEQQQPKVITVDVSEESPQPPATSSVDSAQLTVSVAKQQGSLNSEVSSHQITMEKTITHNSTDTKGSQQNSRAAITTSSTVTTSSAAPLSSKQSTESVDESDGSPQAADQQDFDFSDTKFNDILNDLLELSGESQATKKSSTGGEQSKQSTDKTSAEFHTLSLFSDVPITVPPPKSELVNKQKKESSQITIMVKKEEVAKQQKTNYKSLDSVASYKMESASTTNKPTATSTKKESPPATAPKEPVTIATSKQAPAGKQNVPVAISHKKEMQQQKDGTDMEWSIDLGDIDNDLASQLEELNSIIGQLGVEPSGKDEAVVNSNNTVNKRATHEDTTTEPAAVTTPVTSDMQQLKYDSTTNVTIDNNLIVTLSNVNTKLSNNVQLTKKETILLYETRKKVVTNIVEYCMTISKGDKSAALNLALTLSTTYNLDASTISEISNFINTGVYTEMAVMPANMSKMVVNGNNSKSGSAVSLLSAEAEQALLKQQEEHMKNTERHFQEQAVVQNDLKIQLLEQSKLQKEAQRQSMSFAEAQSRQSRMLEEAQRQVQEQAERLRQAELKLREAEFMSKEKALESDRERILREAQQQQRRAQLEYEEKNKLIITMQNQLKEMQEFQQTLMQRFEEQNRTHMEKIEEYQKKLAKAEASGKKRVRIRDERADSDSEEEPMMTAVGPSLQSKIMSHAEARTMEAPIYRTEPLSHRLMAEESIPGAPPVPNIDMLLDNKTRLKNRTSTIKAAERSASVFDKFEKGAFDDDIDDDDDDDDDMEFAQPRLMSQGATEAKTALIKHKTSSHTIEIPDHGYYRSTYSIAPTTKPPNVKTFEKMPGDFQMRHYKVPQ